MTKAVSNKTTNMAQVKNRKKQKRGKQQEKYLNIDWMKKRRHMWTIKGPDDRLPMFNRTLVSTAAERQCVRLHKLRYAQLAKVTPTRRCVSADVTSNLSHAAMR